MTEWKNKTLNREKSNNPYKKTEPYGFVKNNNLFRDVAYNDRNLTAYPKLLLCYLITHCDKDGECFPSLTQIAKDQGVTRQAIQNRLFPLLKYGYVFREETYSSNGRQKSNTYRLNLDLLKNQNISELTEVSCTPATSSDCSPATPEDCSSAIFGDCTKKPLKIPDNKYSEFDLNIILKEVREFALKDLEVIERARTNAEIQNKAQSITSPKASLQFQINQLIQHGLDRGISLHRFTKFL